MLTIGDRELVIQIDPQIGGLRKFRTGKVSFRNSGSVLQLPDRTAEQELIGVARRVLIAQGASEDELSRLRTEGIDYAQKVILRVRRAMVAEAWQDISRSPEASRTASESKTSQERARQGKLVGGLIAAAVLGGVLLERFWFLLESFQQ